MLAIIFNEIEEKFSQLSYEEQLRLIERLVRRLRESSINSRSSEKNLFSSELAAMASDPEMQAELKKINHEFMITESDGLARV